MSRETLFGDLPESEPAERTGAGAPRLREPKRDQIELRAVDIESLIGEDGGRECVKLESQVLITNKGAVRLDSFPWEEV